MFSPYLKRIIIDVCLFLALALGLVFFSKVFIDFLISLFHFDDKVNIPSFMYCIQRFVYALLPLIILTNKMPFQKINVIKALFYILGGCYILGNTWIFYFLPHHSFSNLLTASIPVWFANDTLLQAIEEAHEVCRYYQYEHALVFNYLVWDSYDLFGIIFSFIQGFLLIRMGHLIEDHKANVVRRFMIISILSLAIPLLYGIAVRGRFMFTTEWGQRNILLIFESFFIYIALRIAATTRSFWADILY